MNARFLFLLVFLSFPLHADPILDSFLNDLHTLYARFEQKQYNEKKNLMETSSGEVYLQRPGKFHWSYQKPYEQTIIADGHKVWIYDRDLEQVTVKKLDAALGKTPALLLSSEKRIDEDFTVTALPPSADLTSFELKPKGQEVQFTSIRLNLQGKTLRSLELLDNLGQTTVITFNQVTQNIMLKESVFVFVPPTGIDIIDGSE